MEAGKSYRELLAEQCSGIVSKVLRGMKEAKVSEIKLKTTNPILYRWLFPIEPESELFKAVDAFYNDSKANPKHENILEGLPKIEKDGKLYYALYFGKSNKGSRRYRQHKSGNVHLSTLRHTIYGLCVGPEYDKEKEKIVDNILQNCYCEWYEFKEEGNLVECIEGICIALGKYPLNVEGNPNISDEWRQYVLGKRKLIE